MRSTRRLAARSSGVALGGGGPAVIAAFVLVSSGAAPARLSAQSSPIVIEARGGAAVPVRSFANGADPGEGTEPGASFGADIAIAGGGHWTPYVGFSQHRFGCEGAGCAAGGAYVSTGFHGGARFLPLPDGSVLPWLGVGAVTVHVEAGDLGPANAGVSKLGVGGEAALGLHVGAASRIAVNPTVRFVAVSTELPDGTSLGMRYLVADVALVLSF